MAGYFSNHSQSRFLANSTAQLPANATASTLPAHAPPAGPVPPRPRVASSKHFSTSVSGLATSADEGPSGKDKVAGNGTSNGLSGGVHPLRNTWVFWFRQQRAPGNKITNYEEGIKKISAFSSVESFWSLWTHMNPPSTLQPTTDYLLFHTGVRRPVWEDPLNITGGKWIIRLKKGVADRLWEEIVMAIVGDQFDDCGNGAGGEEEAEICGCTISVRQSEDILSIWNREGADAKVTGRVKDTIRRVLNLPLTTVMEYKTNNDSMQDKSSFRIDRSTPS